MTKGRVIKTILSAFAAMIVLGAAGTSPVAYAQGAYPNRPIKFIVPYSPGGLGDSFARTFGQGLSERLGQPVIVENMPGASQAIGAAAAAKSAPDGYTLFKGTQSGQIINTLARKKLPYDPVKDFTPISMLFSTPLYLVVHPSVEAKSLKELVALAKAKPDALTVATIGEGTAPHLASVMFENRANVQLLQIPYKGSAPAISDVLGGRVHMMFEGGASALPYVRQGQLRAFASTSEKRTEKAAPGLPTISETYPGFSIEPWFGLVAPAGVPSQVIERLNSAVKEIQKSPKVLELAENLGASVIASTPDELGSRIKTELVEFAKIMKDAGIEPQ
ncbi:MAG: tripartite tricarboxylate transporter substrate binding protein [Noviherbaspirillum sp.]|nr:tripartite tricarboxylate transporter substrate binding protein [Noviherbaspirillum sp.]